MKGYSICGKFIGIGARWQYWLYLDKDQTLIRQWWPGEGRWGESQVWTDEGWRVITESETSYLFPAQSDVRH